MSEQRKQINYTVACVSEFARRFGLNLAVAFDYLYTYKAIEFIKENYDKVREELRLEAWSSKAEIYFENTAFQLANQMHSRDAVLYNTRK